MIADRYKSRSEIPAGDWVALMVWDNAHYPIDRVTGAEPLSERFKKIRANYVTKARAVKDGADAWERSDPYELADWLKVFTPIEYAAWCEIRGAGLPLWPQLPVGKFFVDFGNPEYKVALECDGKDYHDATKDAERDRILSGMGWKVFRAPGWRCNKQMKRPGELLAEQGEEVTGEYCEAFERQTLAGVINELREAMGRRGWTW